MSVPEAMSTLVSMKRLWVHEILRVFGDRLIDEIDMNWLIEQLHLTLRKHMETSMEELFKDFLQASKTKKVLYITCDYDQNILLFHGSLFYLSFQITDYEMRKLLYCDFIDTKVDVRLYKEVFDLEKLREIVEAYLTEYNAMSKKPMHLVMFR